MLRRQKRDGGRPLLVQERPILSDELPEDPENPQKKKFWRKRLFRGGKKAKKTGGSDDSGDPSNDYIVPSLSKSSSSTSEDPPGRQQRQQQQPQEPPSSQKQQQHQRQANRKQEKRDDSTCTTSQYSSAEPYQVDKEEEEQLSKLGLHHSHHKVKKEQQQPSLHQGHPQHDDHRHRHHRPSAATPTPTPHPRSFATTDLGSPQPTVMSTFSKKKTPRAKGGSIDNIMNNHQISTASAPSSTAIALLKRPFGRDGLATSQQTWIVQISAAEWEPEESMWKYRVTVQKRMSDRVQDTGSTFRSLPDFIWLERSLQLEFHGGLLLPSLNIALGVPDLAECQHEVDARLLSNWLSDVLNGVRGQGEMVYKADKVDLIASESMEAFLYRIELKEQMLDLPESPVGMTPRGGEGEAHVDEDEEPKFLSWVYPELCANAGCVKVSVTTRQPKSPTQQRKLKPRLPLRKMNCASAALGGGRSFDVQNSFIETTATFDTAHQVSAAIHSDVLKAEKDLVWSWRTKALKVMEKMRVLQEQEKQVGLAWKRFAITVSNLFAYEKDVESAKLGDSKTRQHMQFPYRKLQKSAVDDCLRILARQRVERSTPSLESVGLMLSAYVADLSAVQPAVQSYLEGLQQLSIQQEKCELLKPDNDSRNQATSAGGIASQIQAGIMDLQKQLGTTADGGSSDKYDAYLRQKQQTHIVETRVQMNEMMLKDFLTTLCKTAPIRTARMAYTYFYVESRQCSLLHGAAINMKSKINVTTKESLTKMISRHHREEAGDRAIEMNIVQRLVNINNTKKFMKDETNGMSEEVEKGVEINKDVVNEEAEKAKLRDKALQLCRERIGRWDARLSMVTMEAVGITDANVRVEETTRDLRMVRKYAIGLRENVQRCTEALVNVRTAVLNGEFGDIRDMRYDFVAEIQQLFSTVYVPVDDIKRPPSSEKLGRAGIRLNDPSGWGRTDEGTCGGAAKRYMENRESSAEWLLDSLDELLKEYDQRIEAVESFVYMECVGIQLEKHFSQNRATALAAFEKKTDITSAINIATRKRMPALVKELQAKLADAGAVTHTTVKEAKEAHLESKKLKEELHALGMRRLCRAQETSTERVIALMTVWSKEDEGTANTELMLLQEVIRSLEHSLGEEEVKAYLEVSPASLAGS